MGSHQIFAARTGTPPPPPGTNDFSLLFDGSSQYGTIDAVLAPNTDFTFECWVKLDSEGLNPIFSSFTDGSHYWIIIARNSAPNAITVQYDTGFGGVFIEAADPIATGSWVHIALTRASDVWQWYLDGTPSVTISTATGTAIDTVATLDANATQSIANLTSLFWPGRIDEIRIWDIARSSVEIAANKSVVLDPGSNPNITGYWRFEDGSGSTAVDELGLNDATLVGTPTWSADVPF